MSAKIPIKKSAAEVFKEIIAIKRKVSSQISDSPDMPHSRRRVSEIFSPDKFKGKLGHNTSANSPNPFLQIPDNSSNSPVKNKEKREEEKALTKIYDTTNFDAKIFSLEDELDVKIFIMLLQKSLKRNDEMGALSRFFQDFNFFQNVSKKLPHKSYQSLIKKLKYEFVPKHSTVFSKGEVGKKFYIILRGKVALLQSKEGLSPETKKSQEKNIRRRSVFKKSDSTQKLNDDEKRVTTENERKLTTENDRKTTENDRKNTAENDLTPNMRQSSEKNLLAGLKPVPVVSTFSAYSANVINTSSGSSGISAPIINIITALARNKSNPAQTYGTRESRASNNDSEIKDNMDDEFEDYILSKHPSSFKVKTFGTGIAFGELGLMEGARRTATVVTEEDTHFAVLTKEDYDETLGQYHQQMYRDRIEFLKSLPFFTEWNLTKLSSVLMITEIKDFQKNNFIYEEGDSPDYLYFIKEGEIELLEKLHWKEQTSVRESLRIVKNALESRPSLLKQKTSRKPV